MGGGGGGGELGMMLLRTIAAGLDTDAQEIYNIYIYISLTKLFNEQVLNKLFNEQLLKSSDQDALNTTTKFTSSFFDELLQRSDKVYGILITVSFG